MSRCPYPPYGTLNFFDQAAKHVLDGIKSDRGTAILPQRTGPVIDVLYSAAGNSADKAYYNHGIIGYDFEIGTSQQPAIAEGMAQASEFSAGNYGLLRSALEYSNDTAPPVVNALVDSEGKGTYEVRFTSNEASSIYYTLDGSTPTTASTEWKPPRPRALPLPVDRESRRDAEVDRHRLQGQRVRSEVDGARADADAWRRERHRAGHAVADDRPGELRRVRAGRRPHLHRAVDGQRHLDGG